MNQKDKLTEATIKALQGKLTEGFEKAQAILSLSNIQSMGIIVSDDGETVQYMYSDSPDEVFESDIEFNEEGEPYFKDEEGSIWMISDFMRTNYMNESKKLKEAKGSDIKLKSNKKDSTWIGGEALIKNKPYTISAKVFNRGSDFGIDKGPVSKLTIKDKDENKYIINYDRGWDIKPTKATKEIYREILKAVTEFRKNNPYKSDEDDED